MAIDKEITDSKGVITRYHKIQGFEADRSRLTVKVRSFVSEELRQQELASENAAIAEADRQLQIEDLQNQITALMGQNSDGSKTQEISQLSNQVNDLVMTGAASSAPNTTKLHATEVEINLPYFEPLTYQAIYQAIVDGDNLLAGGTQA